MNRDQCIALLIHENQALQTSRSLFLALNSILFTIFIFSIDNIEGFGYSYFSKIPINEIIFNNLAILLTFVVGVSLNILWSKMSIPQTNRINYIEWLLHQFQDNSFSIDFNTFHKNLGLAFQVWSDLIETEDKYALKINNRTNNNKKVSTRILFNKLPNLLTILWCGTFVLVTFGSR